MKASARIGRSLFPFVVLALLLGATHRHAWAGRNRAPVLDPPTCDVVIESTGSIQTAIDIAANGDTLCVRGGIYYERVQVPSNKMNLTLMAFPDETPIIDGDRRLPSNLPERRFMFLVALVGDGTVFDGFEVRNSSARGLGISGNNITVRNTSVHDNWDAGIISRSSPKANNILVENNRVYNNLLKARFIPVIYRGERSGEGPTGWSFDPDQNWDSPFWTGADADLPETWLNGISMTFNTDGLTSRIYAGTARAGRIGNIGAEYSTDGTAFTYTGADILFHTPANNKWTLYFKGGGRGLPSGTIIDAFQIESAPPEALASIIMSFAETVTIPVDTGQGIAPTQIGPSDLVRFTPTAVDNLDRIIGGAFTSYRRAADLGLPPEINIDALDRTPDGRLLISVDSILTVGSETIDHEDLAVYDEWTGAWSLYFDGDQIPYNPFGTELTAAWLDNNGHIYIGGNPVGGSALAFIDTTDSTARGNYVYNNYGEGIVAGRFSERITLEENITYDNQHANLYLNSTIAPLVQRNLVFCTNDKRFWRKGSAVNYRPGPGIQLRDEDFEEQPVSPPPSTGQIIINNIVIGCGNNFGVSTQTPGGGLNNALVANNTFANARAETGSSVYNIELSGEASYAGSSFINNLILQNTPGAVLRVQGISDFATFTVANNLYSSAPPTSWFDGEHGRVVGNPQLVDPTPPLPVAGAIPDPADYRLTYGSPAFDAGRALDEMTADYFNQSRVATGLPDIGVHELPYKGTIIVAHAVQPSGQMFDFSAAYAPGGFQLGDGQEHDSGLLDVGVYNVAVAPVPGWATTVTCDDGSAAEAVELTPGETVTCAFTSTREARLTVVNTATPASDPQLFDFDLSPGELFQLGSASHTVIVQPGVAHALTVAVPDGWRQTAAICDNGASPDTITLNAGDIVTCSFAHEKLGRIIIHKKTVPEGTGQHFDFTADYDADGFRLGDGQSDTSAYLAVGTYAVAETLPPGWAQTSAICDDGSAIDAIALDVDETVTCTFTNSRTVAGLLATFYVTTPKAGTVRGLAYAPGDILAYDARVDAWSLYFDASDVGIAKPLGDFVLMADGSILMTFNAQVRPRDAAGNLLTVAIQDVARFVPAGLGPTTAGAFEMYFDGSDVGLSTSDEKIDALARKDDGTLLISTTGAAAVKNGTVTVKAQDEDLLAFAPASVGPATAGVWSLAFDGSTLTGMAAQDVTAAWYDQATGDLYLTITNNFTVNGVSGTNRTVLAVTPSRAVSVYWDATSAGFAKLVDGLHIFRE